MAEKRGRKSAAAKAKAAPRKAPSGPKKAAKGPDRPSPPSELPEVALEAWGSLCDDLAEQKTLDRTDRKLMEAYCRLYATFRRIEKQLAGEDLTKLSAQNGRVFINPLVACQSDYANKLRQNRCWPRKRVGSHGGYYLCVDRVIPQGVARRIRKTPSETDTRAA